MHTAKSNVHQKRKCSKVHFSIGLGCSGQRHLIHLSTAGNERKVRASGQRRETKQKIRSGGSNGQNHISSTALSNGNIMGPQRPF